MEYWSIGVLECWSVGVMGKQGFPLLHYSTTPLFQLKL